MAATSKSTKTDADVPAGSESERVAEMIHEAIDRLAVHASDAEKRIKAAATEAQGKVESTKQRAKAKGNQAAAITEDYVDQHPWAALGIAFGAGIVISSLLRR